MRNFFTIALCILCLNMVFSQTINTQYKRYERNGFTDTFRLAADWNLFLDKNRCLDTFQTEYRNLLSYSSSEKFYRSASRKYDDKKRVIEVVNKRTFVTTKLITNELIDQSTTIDRDKIFYAPISPKYDSIVNELYDTITKKWSYNKHSLPKRRGFGNDTVVEPNHMYIVDEFGYRSLDVYKLNGKTTDSTGYVLDSKGRFLSYVFYSVGYVKTDPLKLVVGNYVSYEGDNVVKELSLGLTDKDTSRTVTDYKYTNGVLSSKEIYTESIPFGGKPVMQSRTRTLFTKYNNAKRCLEAVTEKGSITNNTWSTVNISYKTYFQDTLVKTENVIGYTNNQLNGIDIQHILEYDACTSVQSSTDDVNKGVDFTLAPNPSTGYFNIAIDEKNTQTDMTVSVYNIQGGEVFRTKLTSESTAIDLSNLSRGFYLVKVADKSRFTVKKLVLN
jgi:Secretion system C-terminal sorting domain